MRSREGTRLSTVFTQNHSCSRSLKRRTVIRFCIFGTTFTICSFLLALFHAERQGNNDERPFSGNSNSDACGAWGLPNLLLYSPRTTVKHESNDTLQFSNWQHFRSGAYSALGFMTASVFHCKPGALPVGDRGQQISPSSTLCRGDGAVVVQVKLGTFDDILSTSKEGVNLWHWHASAMRLWVSLRLIDAVAYDREHKGSRPSNLELPFQPKPVVLVIPEAAWSIFLLPDHINAFPSTWEMLQRFQRHGSPDTPLEALQGITDVLGGKVLVAKEGISVAALEAAQRAARFPPGIAAWTIPPTDPNHMFPGLLWDIAHDEKLASTLTACRRSLLQEYADELIKTAQTHPSHHVCFMSRQSRGRNGNQSRGKLRNLESHFFSHLVQRLSAPLVLSPSFGLRKSTWREIPLLLDHASIAGQLQFIRDECAVLVGVHGAGMTSGMALARGAAMIELMPKRMEVYYFKNLAALMSDVSYDVVTISASGDIQDVDLVLDDSELDRLIELVRLRLFQSVSRQNKELNSLR